MSSIVELGMGNDRLRSQRPLGVEFDLGIKPAHPVRSPNTGVVGTDRIGHSVQLAIGKDEANCGLFADVVVNTQNRVVRLVTRKRIVDWNFVAGMLVVGE